MKRGFTLIDVMVALTVGSAVVALVHHSYSSAVALSTRLAEARETLGAELTAARLLTRALGSLEIGVDPSQVFEGAASRVSFSMADGGRQSRVTVDISDGWLVLQRDSSVIQLLPAVALEIDYLMAAGADEEWAWSWRSPASAPVALRLRILRDTARVDTMLLMIGPRG